MAVHRRARSTRLLVASLVAASLMTITLDSRGGDRGPLAAIGRVGVGIVTPLQEAVSAIFRPIGNVFSTIGDLGQLRDENEQLRQELRRVRGERIEVQVLRSQVETLTKLLDLRQLLDFDTRGATVIGESVSNFEWSVTIDRGSADGVKVDMPVISGDGLVGRVSKVTTSSSTVMLIIDPESQVAVRLAGSRETGLLVGRREQDLRMELVDPKTEVRPGELVVTSGFEGGIFPAGIPVGEVSEVLPSEIDLTKHVLVRPNVNFSAMDHVAVVFPHAGIGEKGN